MTIILYVFIRIVKTFCKQTDYIRMQYKKTGITVSDVARVLSGSVQGIRHNGKDLHRDGAEIKNIFKMLIDNVYKMRIIEL